MSALDRLTDLVERRYGKATGVSCDRVRWPFDSTRRYGVTIYLTDARGAVFLGSGIVATQSEAIRRVRALIGGR